MCARPIYTLTQFSADCDAAMYASTFFWMDECMRKLHALHIFVHIVIDKSAERMGKIPSDSYFAVLQYFFLSDYGQ